MKSKFFKDTQGLESAFECCSPDKVSVCLRMDRSAYDMLLMQSCHLGLTSGQYIEALILAQAQAPRSHVSPCGTEARTRPSAPLPRSR